MAIVLSVVITIKMFDYSVSIVGLIPTVLINVVLFGAAIVLMVYDSAHRNNVARLLLIPFIVLLLFYDLSHLGQMMSRGPTPYCAAGRILLIAATIHALFTPASRARIGRRLLPPEALEENELQKTAAADDDHR